jgi:hypothetical protein
MENNQVMYMLGQIDAKVEGIQVHLAALNSKVAKHETELNGIRLTAAKIGGMILVVAGIASVAWSFFFDWLRRLLGI